MLCIDIYQCFLFRITFFYFHNISGLLPNIFTFCNCIANKPKSRKLFLTLFSESQTKSQPPLLLCFANETLHLFRRVGSSVVTCQTERMNFICVDFLTPHFFTAWVCCQIKCPNRKLYIFHVAKIQPRNTISRMLNG